MISFIALLLDIVFGIYIQTAFMIILLIIMGRNLKMKPKKFYILSFLLGLFYDCIFTSVLFLNATLFLIIANISIFYKKINFFIFSFLILFLYKTSIYIIFYVLGKINFDINIYLSGIFKFMLSNILIVLISYFIKKRIYINRWKYEWRII